MKKYSLFLLVFFLLFTNVSLISAQEAIHSVQENTNSEQTEVLIPQNVSSIAQHFGVSEHWLNNEVTKGYSLSHIYQGLLEQQKGNSYELYMQGLYPHASELIIRKKRSNPVLIRGTIAAGTVVARVAKPYVDNAVKATVNFTKNVADDVVQGARSMYQNVTTGRSVRNIQTDVTRESFESTLQSNGWSKTTQNGVNHFTKDNARYTTRSNSNCGNPTADYYPNGIGKPTTKIRLGE